MFAEAIEDILRDYCTPAMVRAIEDGASPAHLWDALAGAGYLDLMRPEVDGGAALALDELYPVLAHFGRHAVPVPVGQSIVARALLAPGTELPAGLLTIAPVIRKGIGGSVCCPLVPFGAIAQYVLAADGEQLLLLDCRIAQRELTGTVRSQLATLTWPEQVEERAVDGDGAQLAAAAAALHAALLAGAMERVFEMTLHYCNERSQFGKSLGKFQAVQHQLSVMAEQVAAASIAVQAAYQGAGLVPRLWLAAMAKARASEAAPGVANIAHALHGAIGITEEYDLQLLTRRLHEWRFAHGAESHWNRLIGEQVLASGGALFEWVRVA